jgi:hypothetical protein
VPVICGRHCCRSFEVPCTSQPNPALSDWADILRSYCARERQGARLTLPTSAREGGRRDFEARREFRRKVGEQAAFRGSKAKPANPTLPSWANVLRAYGAPRFGLASCAATVRLKRHNLRHRTSQAPEARQKLDRPGRAGIRTKKQASAVGATLAKCEVRVIFHAVLFQQCGELLIKSHFCVMRFLSLNVPNYGGKVG